MKLEFYCGKKYRKGTGVKSFRDVGFGIVSVFNC